VLLYAEVGKLGKQCERLLGIFPRAQVKLVLTEDFGVRIAKVYREVLEPFEEGEDPADRVLHAPVGIHLQPVFTRPEVPDRYRGPQLAPAGLGARGIEQAAAKQRQLELAHRPLSPSSSRSFGTLGS
jgi:hypothetical protein